MNFWAKIFLISIFLLALFLRIYKVADTPHDLYIDEVAIGYNAYSVLTTGNDEHGVHFPLFFKSFGDYKLPVYIYLTVLSEAVLGNNALAVRLPSVLFGTASIILFILLTRLTTRSNRLSLLAGLLLTISPWHLQFSRAGFEANLALFFVISGTYFILLEFIKNRQTFFVGILMFIFSMYTYHTARIFVPLLLLFLLILYVDKVKAIIKKRYSIPLFLFLICITLPFIIYAFSHEGLARAKQESLLKDYSLGTQGSFVLKNIWGLNEYLKNYLSYTSLDFHFFSGDQIGRHSVREMGMNYLWQLPFLIIGLAAAKKFRKRQDKLFLSWLFLSPLAASLVTPNPHALRSLPLIIPIIYFVSKGVLITLERWPRLRFGVVLLVCYFLVSYLHIYYVHYPERTSPDWSGGWKQAIEYVNAREKDYEVIALTNNQKYSYIYLYFYGNFDPSEIQNSQTRERGHGKFRFVDMFYQAEPNKKTLYVALPTDTFSGRVLTTIYDRGEDEVFKIWEN